MSVNGIAGVLHNWSVRRASSGMTITHSTGKITNIENIEFARDGVYAYHKRGACYRLHIPKVDH